MNFFTTSSILLRYILTLSIFAPSLINAGRNGSLAGAAILAGVGAGLTTAAVASACDGDYPCYGPYPYAYYGPYYGPYPYGYGYGPGYYWPAYGPRY